VTGKVFTDERTIAAYREILHNRLNQQAMQVAWAYAYTGEGRYAAAVREALLRLAADYPNYPNRRDRWGRSGWLARLGGRRYTQSLSEAVGIIELAKAYDLVASDPGWTDADRTRVETEFFRATADSLLRFNQDINNHQTWYNAGLMAIAGALGDAALARRVLTMKGGFFDQLHRSLGDDGLWYEGAIAYHFYALSAMMEIAEIGRRIGLPLHDVARFRLMFDGPLNAAWPNGVFPAINDSDRVSINGYRRQYQWAADFFQVPEYADPAARLSTESLDLPDTGLMILRRGVGDQAVAAMIDYGPHGGGHGHFDKLQLILYAAGREWLLDPGRLTYSHKQYLTWVKHTAAHNTVTIDGRNQAPHTGRLIWRDINDTFVACAAESNDAYPDVRMRRSLLMTDSVLVDVFLVDATRDVTMDWFAHGDSDELIPTADVTLTAHGPLGQADGYSHLESVQRADAAVGRWDFVTGKGDKTSRLRMWTPSDGRETVFTAVGIGYHLNHRVPCLVRRRQGRSAVFVAVYDLTGRGDAVTGVEIDPAHPLRVTVRMPAGDRRADFTDEGVTWESAE